MRNTILFIIKEDEYLKFRHEFFCEILRKSFKLTTLVILKDWKKEFLNTPFNSKKYKATIVWGEIFDTKLLNEIKTSNFIFIPMADFVHSKKLAWWFRLRNFKTICFSKRLSEALIKHNFRLFNFLYVPNSNKNIVKLPKKISEKKVLNVYVSGEINSKTQLILNKLFKFQKYNIHDKLQKNTHLYLSLNKYSGLDLDFLKAISMGVIPIVPNNYNLNDYVFHNKTGYLYKYDLPLFIDFSNINEIQANLLNFINVNSHRWKIKSKQVDGIIRLKNHSSLDYDKKN